MYAPALFGFALYIVMIFIGNMHMFIQVYNGAEKLISNFLSTPPVVS